MQRSSQTHQVSWKNRKICLWTEKPEKAGKSGKRKVNATHYIGRVNNLQGGTQTEYGLRTSVCGQREEANTKNWCISFATLKCERCVHPPSQDRLGTVKEIHRYPGCP